MDLASFYEYEYGLDTRSVVAGPPQLPIAGWLATGRTLKSARQLNIILFMAQLNL